MNLVPVEQSVETVKMFCVNCNMTFAEQELYADLDGLAFVSYYCYYCVEGIKS